MFVIGLALLAIGFIIIYQFGELPTPARIGAVFNLVGLCFSIASLAV